MKKKTNAWTQPMQKSLVQSEKREFIAGSPIPNDQPVGEDGKKKGGHLQRKKGALSNVLLEKIDY